MRQYFQDREYILDTFASNKESSIFNRHFSALGNLKFIWIALAYRKGSFFLKVSNKHIKTNT